MLQYHPHATDAIANSTFTSPPFSPTFPAYPIHKDLYNVLVRIQPCLRSMKEKERMKANLGMASEPTVRFFSSLEI